MITVRFPSGFSVQYNNLNYLSWNEDGTASLYVSKDVKDAGKGWSVLVPVGCLIEFIAPCRTYQAAEEGAWEMVTRLSQELAAVKREMAKIRKEVVKK